MNFGNGGRYGAYALKEMGGGVLREGVNIGAVFDVEVCICEKGGICSGSIL